MKLWPKLCQNLRSTRETELAEQYPIHVVCEWIGASQPVAMKHYLQVTEEHFEQALQGDATDNAECNALGAEKATQNTTQPVSVISSQNDTNGHNDNQDKALRPAVATSGETCPVQGSAFGYSNGMVFHVVVPMWQWSSISAGVLM